MSFVRCLEAVGGGDDPGAEVDASEWCWGTPSRRGHQAQLRYLSEVGEIHGSTDPKTMSLYTITVEGLLRHPLGQHVQFMGSHRNWSPICVGIAQNVCFLSRLDPSPLVGPLAGISHGAWMQRMQHLMQLVVYMRAAMKSVDQMSSLLTDGKSPHADVPKPPELDVDSDSITPIQRLLEFYFNRACEMNVRRKDNAIYVPVRHGAFITRYFKYHSEVDDWLFECVSPSQQYCEYYLTLTGSRGHPGHLTHLLTKVVDQRLPILKKKRTLFSFSNGIFDATTGLFHWYVSPDHHSEHHTVAELDDSFSTANFFERDFPAGMVPMDSPIATPSFDRILKAQGYCAEAMTWLYALTGRLLHDVGTDEWQVCLYIYGVAASGKSTYLRLFSEVYEPQDVGFLSDDCERNFLDQHLLGKLVVLCLDISADLRLPKTRFNSWITGEPVTVNRKFLTAITQKWTAPLAAASNELPPIASTNGSGTRRFAIFPFQKMVRNLDMGLYAKCQKELPLWLVKIARLYNQKRASYGSKDIWSADIPTMVHEARELYSAEQCPRVNFLLQSGMIEFDDASSESISDLTMAYNSFVGTRRQFRDMPSARQFSQAHLSQAISTMTGRQLRIEDDRLHGIRLVEAA